MRAADGTWSVPLTCATPARIACSPTSSRRDGPGTDPRCRPFGRRALPARAAPGAGSHHLVDGFARLARRAQPLAPVEETELAFTVTRGGRAVTDLQPYLGAFGHLVSLRSGDLAYLHVHPVAEAHGHERGGPTVRFATEFPTAGTYRLFLDFRVDGTVRTAAFTVSVDGGLTTATAPTVEPAAPSSSTIGGMTCASCAARVEKKLNRIDGVTATVNYATEKATVTVGDGVTVEDLVATVEATGYTAAPPPPPRATGAGPAAEAAADPDAVGALRRRVLVSLRPRGAGHRRCRWCPRCSSTAGSGCR